MDLLGELTWRGLLQDISDPQAFSKIKAGEGSYTGFDPTAKSLQIGNLVPLLVSMHLAKAGIRPILLFGGATGMIGDPGGRSSERNLLSLEEVARNVELQESQAKTLWRNAGLSEMPEIVNNITWTKDVSYLSFLRDVGKHFTVNYMLQKDSVKSRLSGDGISYTEFSYMLLQAFDFLHLYQHHGVRVQLGGSEQWGNLTAGLELIRRKIQGEAYAFSFPLITNSEGKKFGKSAGNAVWLDRSLTSPYKFHQFWLNTPDTEVVKLIKVFTFASQEEARVLDEGVAKDPAKRAAQAFLADSLCNLVHGVDATEDAKRCAAVLFGGSFEGLSDQQILDIFAEAPCTEVKKSDVAAMDMASLLGTTVANSKGEARRLVQGGGIYVDNQRMSDPAMQVSATQLLAKGFIILRSGKKNYHLVKAVD